MYIVLKYISAPCTGMIYSSLYVFGVILRQGWLPTLKKILPVFLYWASKNLTPDWPKLGECWSKAKCVSKWRLYWTWTVCSCRCGWFYRRYNHLWYAYIARNTCRCLCIPNFFINSSLYGAKSIKQHVRDHCRVLLLFLLVCFFCQRAFYLWQYQYWAWFYLLYYTMKVG